MYSNRVVLLEEPEIHLHPELQRKFLHFIAEHTTNKYFITTHSNIFLDADPQIGIYHVRYDGTASNVIEAQTSTTARDVLADLGYKASDLLQANCIIWVEGPSDRIYLNKWFSMAAQDLVEGIDYAVMFFGGSGSVSHLTSDNSLADDFVRLRRINPNMAVLLDSDRDHAGTQLSSETQRISAELGKDCWITEGRSIENYLRIDLVRSCLIADTSSASSLSFGPYERVIEVVKALPGRQKSCKKVVCAKLFTSAMTTDDLDVLDLRTQITFLVEQIRHWNRTNVPSPRA